MEDQSYIFADNSGPTDARRGTGIEIEAGAVRVDSGAIVSTDALGRGDAARLFVRAGRIGIQDGLIRSVAVEDATGNAGSVVIAADRIELLDSGQIFSGTFGIGNGGTVEVTAGSILATGRRQLGSSFFPSGILATAEPGSRGDAGAVTVTADELEVRKGGVISSDTYAGGNAGKVTVTAGRLLVSGDGSPFFTGIFSDANPGSGGDAGAVTVTADDLVIRDGSIASNTSGAGRGRAVVVAARELRVLDGGDISAETFGTGADAGRGGDVTVTATAGIELASRGFISVATLGDGDAGEVRVSAPRLRLDNGAIVASTGLNDIVDTKGDAGTVTIEAGELVFVNEGRIFNGTYSRGDGGDIVVHARTILADATLNLDEFHTFNHTGISAAANFASRGKGGRVLVTADRIRLSNGGEISSDSDGFGDAGSIQVVAPEITLVDGGNIASFSTGEGDAGSIHVIASDRLAIEDGRITTTSDQRGGGQIALAVGELLHLADGAEITSTVSGGEGTTAGDITIDTRFITLNGSRIVAQANEGRGGNIDIRADNILASIDSLIDASSRLGVSGTVSISSPETDLTGGLTVLPTVFLDADDLLRESCAARRTGATSSFTAMGRGGLPPDPAGPLAGSYLEPGGAAATDQAGPVLASSFGEGCR
jgi:large exoprotein involved in heme utilization and adhesion